MVTLAFAQAGSVLAFKNPWQLTGGEDGFGVDYTKLPDGVRRDLQHEEPLLARARLRGVRVRRRAAGRSTRRRATSGRRSARTSCASRCSGCAPFDFKLMSFVLASFLATLGGIVYLMLISGASPTVTTPNFTLALLVMVVIGGTGSRWGAMIGGLVYTYLDHRLADLAGSHAISRAAVGAADAAAGAALHPRRCSSSWSSTSRRAGSRGSAASAARPRALEEANV